MKSKAQVLIISLWILVILSVLAISIGHRVSMALRLTRYQRESLKALYLAKAGINRAISELKNDTNGYDSLNETWSTGKDSKDNPIFENIEIKERSGEIFTISIVDEERKINLNNTNEQLLKQELIELFIIKEISLDKSEAENLANIIIDWIDKDTIKQDTTDEDKIFKNSPLKTPEELLAILEYFYQNKGETKFQEKAQEVYNKIKDVITVYGDNYKVNVNTASEDVLRIIGRAVAQNILPDNILDKKKFGDTVIDEIISLRKKVGFFEEINVIDILFTTGSEEENVLNHLKTQHLSVKSDNFRIKVTGKVKNIAKNITAIYNRIETTTKKILSWHES